MERSLWKNVPSAMLELCSRAYGNAQGGEIQVSELIKVVGTVPVGKCTAININRTRRDAFRRWHGHVPGNHYQRWPCRL